MTASRDQWIRFIVSLLEKTQKNEIVWRIAGDDDTPELADNEIVESVFLTTIAGRFARIYRRKYERSESQMYFDLSLAQGRGSTWRTETVLEIMDPTNTVWGKIPIVSGVSDLYAAVQRQVVQVDDFLKSYFEEK